MNNISLEELWPIMEEQLLAGKTVRFGPKGISMLPLIRQNVDTIVLKKKPGKLKKYDLPLYRRDDGHFVLHRVVGIDKDGYVMCGDNQAIYEHGITDRHILAIAIGMYRGDEYLSFDNKNYIIYVHKQVRKQAIRRMNIKVRACGIYAMKKIGIYNFYKIIKKYIKKT